jgi:hypothetical protein
MIERARRNARAAGSSAWSSFASWTCSAPTWASDVVTLVPRFPE